MKQDAELHAMRVQEQQIKIEEAVALRDLRIEEQQHKIAEQRLRVEMQELKNRLLEAQLAKERKIDLS